MVVDRIIADPEFGHLYIKTNVRAVRYTFRVAHNGGRGILVTVPARYLLADLMNAVERMRPQLRVLLQKAEAQAEQQRQRPQPTAEQVDEAKRKLEQLRKLAKRDLPPMLLALAHEHGFKVKVVKINSARTRWGSCVARKKGIFGQKEYTINLSLYCVLLPEPLLRLVMLHELTHIHHMDHSPAFHRELDAMLDGQEKALQQELKRFSPSLESFTCD